MYCRWVDLTGQSPPVPLILSKVVFLNNPDKNLLESAVTVAQVYSKPSEEELVRRDVNRKPVVCDNSCLSF